jgi:hypothetical protein
MPVTRFAHEAEVECARALDALGIRWAYEPHMFVLSRDAEGRVREAITPDFHLPELGLYVEVTAMRQRHVTRKNRKLRRLHELHPEVRCYTLYARDRVRLAERLGEICALTRAA